MAARGKRALCRAAAGVLAASLLTLSFAAPASAQGIFERIFGGLRHSAQSQPRPPANIQAFVDPFTALANHFNPPPQQQMRVATKTGLMAFTGAKNKVADFTPIDSYRGLNQNSRDKLSEIKIMPPTPALPETTASITPADKARSDDRRRAQLSR